MADLKRYHFQITSFQAGFGSSRWKHYVDAPNIRDAWTAIIAFEKDMEYVTDVHLRFSEDIADYTIKHLTKMVTAL